MWFNWYTDDTVLGEDYIVMPDKYFRRLQIESFTTVKIEKVVDMRKVNYIKIKGHDKNILHGTV